MSISIRLVVYVVLAIGTLGGGWWIYRNIKDSGREEVRKEQKEQFDKLKEHTNETKDKVLTAPPSVVDDELRKFTRPDER